MMMIKRMQSRTGGREFEKIVVLVVVVVVVVPLVTGGEHNGRHAGSKDIRICEYNNIKRDKIMRKITRKNTQKRDKIKYL